MALASFIVDGVFDAFNRRWLKPNEDMYPTTVTSANDSVHTGKPVIGDTKDPHFTGKAIDYRIKHINPEYRGSIYDDIKSALGGSTGEFVVLWEAKGTEDEHIHVQWGRIA